MPKKKLVPFLSLLLFVIFICFSLTAFFYLTLRWNYLIRAKEIGSILSGLGFGVFVTFFTTRIITLARKYNNFSRAIVQVLSKEPIVFWGMICCMVFISSYLFPVLYPSFLVPTPQSGLHSNPSLSIKKNSAIISMDNKKDPLVYSVKTGLFWGDTVVITGEQAGYDLLSETIVLTDIPILSLQKKYTLNFKPQKKGVLDILVEPQTSTVRIKQAGFDTSIVGSVTMELQKGKNTRLEISAPPSHMPFDTSFEMPDSMKKIITLKSVLPGTGQLLVNAHPVNNASYNYTDLMVINNSTQRAIGRTGGSFAMARGSYELYCKGLTANGVPVHSDVFTVTVSVNTLTTMDIAVRRE